MRRMDSVRKREGGACVAQGVVFCPETRHLLDALRGREMVR